MKCNVDLSALTDNALNLRRTVGDYYCVLKCNAYGHGAKLCADALFESGMRHFAVFSLEEALEIYPFVGDSEILILGRTEKDGLAAVSEKGFVQTVFSEEYARELSAFQGDLKLHIKIDTGMNRSGFLPNAENIFSSLSVPRHFV